METQTERDKVKLSNTIKDNISNLIIDLLIIYENINRKDIIKELYNEVYFLNKYQKEVFK